MLHPFWRALTFFWLRAASSEWGKTSPEGREESWEGRSTACRDWAQAPARGSLASQRRLRDPYTACRTAVQRLLREATFLLTGASNSPRLSSTSANQIRPGRGCFGRTIFGQSRRGGRACSDKEG